MTYSDTFITICTSFTLAVTLQRKPQTKNMLSSTEGRTKNFSLISWPPDHLTIWPSDHLTGHFPSQLLNAATVLFWNPLTSTEVSVLGQARIQVDIFKEPPRQKHNMSSALSFPGNKVKHKHFCPHCKPFYSRRSSYCHYRGGNRGAGKP